MKYLKFFILLAILSTAGTSWAIPASKIELSYDPGKKILHTKVSHVTQRNRKHYIRSIIVYKNDQEVKSLHYVVQEKSSGVEEDIPLEANKDEVIRVKAQCTESGPKEETLVIP
ncbi:MAG: hypothetical protein A2787_03165 [Omnitrophica WOR_2 bacterium RIFCSPHIGHO2_01_FULL_48_9]|nr:MAG: hypothetical protein A3D10_01170 [Omnitrophica WOR_2 bacterium RIFCSPHIGHO2_02_FULL_48_11]OGX32017.1 MAG: hypothetical protein A2787_03165 [Omnitrophica WOR_2 bacterium RIFCSPHIGHO2_01_FULL_48_9]